MLSRPVIVLSVLTIVAGSVCGQAAKKKPSAPAAAQRKTIAMPTSTALIDPVPGNPQQLNSFPANLSVSPDGRYVVILNAGYGEVSTSKSGQSIAIVDRQQNTVTE